MPANAETAAPWKDRGPKVSLAEDIPEHDRSEIVALLGSWQPDLFPAPEIRVTVLVGGANNRNYVVKSADAKYALRIANPQNERFAVDRASALKAQREAAGGDLAPAVIAWRLPEGHILSRFIEGRTLLDQEQLRDPDVLALAGRTLRRLHAIETTCRRFSPFDDIALWAGLAEQDGAECPGDLDDLLRRVEEVQAAVAAAGLPEVFCHNDTVPQNFILSGPRMRLVDWDYAGRGLACFELASFCATAELDEALEDVVIGAYDENAGEAQRASIRLLRFVAAMRETTWALMAQPVLQGSTTPPGERDFYASYLETHLEMARDAATDSGFEADLRVASTDDGARSW